MPGPVAIVVDANVARASSNRPGAQTLPLACANSLRAIEDARLQAVMSKEIRKEWQAHASDGYARRWLVRMTSRALIREVDAATDNATLAAARKHLSAADQRAVENDVHLVSAALHTDRRVLSGDEKMRSHLRKLARRVKKLGTLFWENPSSKGCIEWLREGAPETPQRKLGHDPA